MTVNSEKNVLIAFIFIGFLLFTVLAVKLNWLQRADIFLFDHQSQQLLADKPADSKIVVIAIDDYSIENMTSIAGRWVWPRSVHAELLEGLQHHQIKLLAFDILFSEKDLYRPDADSYFNEVLAEQTNVFFSMLALTGEENQGYPLAKFSDVLPLQQTNNSDHHSRALLLLPMAIEKENWRVGVINYQAELDGIGRYYDVYRNISGWKINSLASEIAKQHGVDLPHQNKVLLNWRGHQEQPYQTFTYFDVYQAVVNGDNQFLKQFTGKTILIGSTAAGLYDARTTPINHNLPGVYMLATAIDNLINHKYYQEVEGITPLLLAMCFVLLITFCFVYFSQYKKQLLFATSLIVFCVCLGYFLSLYLMSINIAVFIASPLILMIFSFFIYSFVFGYREYLNRQKALSMFGRFLDPQVVLELLSQGKLDKNHLNQKCNLTILFSDIRGFTKLSENKNADQILTLLNNYFSQQVAVIFSTQGTLDKFIGDCIMAFWGAPLASKNQAKDAIEAALIMEENLLAFKNTLPEGMKHFDIGIGIHSGEAVAGLVGTEQRVDYTVIGDAVNLASRIEGLTKNNCRILVSESTKKLAENHFCFNYQGEFNVKGRKALVKLYQPTRK